jgi:hypothetical protein
MSLLGISEILLPPAYATGADNVHIIPIYFVQMITLVIIIELFATAQPMFSRYKVAREACAE